MEEEGHLHGDPQSVPLELVELEVIEPQAAIREQPVVATSRRSPIEQHRAGPTGAQQLARVQVEQVAVLGWQRLAAELATLLLL
jgi:hypothetical protein